MIEKFDHKEHENVAKRNSNYLPDIQQDINENAQENQSFTQNLENFEETNIECEASLDEIDESPKVVKESSQAKVSRAVSLTNIQDKSESTRDIRQKIKDTPYSSLKALPNVTIPEKKLSIGELVSSPDQYTYEYNRQKLGENLGHDDSSKFEFNLKISRTPSQATIGGFLNPNKSNIGKKWHRNYKIITRR